MCQFNAYTVSWNAMHCNAVHLIVILLYVRLTFCWSWSKSLGQAYLTWNSLDVNFKALILWSIWFHPRIHISIQQKNIKKWKRENKINTDLFTQWKSQRKSMEQSFDQFEWNENFYFEIINSNQFDDIIFY